MNDLEMYREQLALCDDKIIDALVERNAIIEKIMAYKETYGMPILQPAQEAKQERRLNEKLKDNKYQDEIHDVFKRILRNSKRIQARKLFSYNIVLIGFMGAGKSTISDYLSTMFDMKLVEMDQEIVELEGDEKTGANIILKALEAPLYQIAKNAGLEGAVIVNKVRESEPGTGFDAYNEKYVNMVEKGILDPAKVTRSALQNATSVASTLLTTESVVATIKEDAPAMPAGGAGGMGMM